MGGVVFSGVVATVAVFPPQLLDVVWCSAVAVIVVGVVVACWSCSCKL